MTPEDICIALSLGCFVVAGLLCCMIARDRKADRNRERNRLLVENKAIQ